MNEKGKATLKICDQKLKVLNYAKTTKEMYIGYINKFLLSQSKSTAHLNAKDFQMYLDNYNFTSVSQQNQIISAIKFLYKYVLSKKYDKVSFARPRQTKKLPKVIETDIILNSLSKIKNIKHKAILSLAYSCGARVSEVCNIKIENIDSSRMLIFIKSGKGDKDRYVPLSENILILLRNYFIEYKPKEYLFNGMSKKHLRYSTSSCRAIFKKYINSKDRTFHSLRHSCFTYLLESGTNLRIIQSIAGHKSSKTTEIYTHVSKKLLNKVVLPI